jgi:tRNA-Thr(GGU) m(6)t(6)A37 methyltransferase TsaA
MTPGEAYELRVLGYVRSPLAEMADAPKQGDEGAPNAVLEMEPSVGRAMTGLRPGDQVVVVTWLHLGNRETLTVHPRGDISRPLAGVFATRSPDRPNPIGLHRVTVTAVEEPARLRVSALEAIDGTPILDLKAVITGSRGE